MKYQLLVFDWDGTLSDSLGHIIQGMQDAAEMMGLGVRPREEILNIIGLGLDEGIRHLYPDLPSPSRKRLAESYRLQYSAATESSPPLYPYAAEIIKSLHSEGYYLAVATGKSRRGLNRALLDADLQSCFHTTRCADETFSKPHPQMLREIMDYLAVPAQRTLMIGDTAHDLQMALNAGVGSIAVNYGAHDVRRLLELKPLLCLDSLMELPGWLSGLES